MIFRLSVSVTVLLKVIPVFEDGSSSNKCDRVHELSIAAVINRKIFPLGENLFLKQKRLFDMCINNGLMIKK
jgi:hypothetical protein